MICRYVFFAVLAVIANLGAQRAVFVFGDDALVYSIAVLVGTLIGLLVKYCLDKRWIFYDTDRSFKNHRKKFISYTATGVVTTSIFWGSETLFWILGQTEMMRELGAVIGLSIGYWLKFSLDRHFVFKKK